MTCNAAAGDNGGGHYGYGTLSSGGQSVCDKIGAALSDFVSSAAYGSDISSDSFPVVEITLPGELSGTEITLDFYTFYYDNPQYYWLSTLHSISSSGKNGTTEKVLRLFVDEQYLSADSRRAADSAIEACASEWIARLSGLLDSSPDDGDRYMIALELHDLIIDRINYAYVNGEPSTLRSAHSIAGVFDKSGAVCEGYARAYQYILNRLDIENVYVTGFSRGEAHAWNAVMLDGKYYCIDTTWDDGNSNSYLQRYSGRIYDYFCTPYSLFHVDHTEENEIYTLPSFADDNRYAYYYRFNSISTSELTDDGAASFISNATASAHGDCVYYVIPSADSLRTLCKALGFYGGTNYINGLYGKIFIQNNIVINTPASSMELTQNGGTVSAENPNEITLGLSAAADFTAQLSSLSGECDDRVTWRISDPDVADISVNGLSCRITAKRNGIFTLTATTSAGKDSDNRPLSVVYTIISGNGIYTPLYTLWAGGTKDKKEITLTTSLSATNWTDDRGKEKKGKLVWLVTKEKKDISFNAAKHTVLTKSDKSLAGVSGKGKVTAKKPGFVYVYCCDTGSMRFECFDIEIMQAPTRLLLSSVPASSDKDFLLRKVSLEVGDSGRVYIVPVFKSAEKQTANTYTVTYARPEDSAYLHFTQPEAVGDGSIFFDISGVDINRAACKAPSVKLIIRNNESGKKTTLTVCVCNPVKGIECNFGNIALIKKGTSSTGTISFITAAGRNVPTTDSLKLLIAGESITVNNGRLVSSGKSCVKAKYNKTSGTVTLTAGRDNMPLCTVAFLAACSPMRTKTLFHVCSVGPDGIPS